MPIIGPLDGQITISEVHKSIDELKGKQATEPDIIHVCNKMFKCKSNNFQTILVHLFNTILEMVTILNNGCTVSLHQYLKMVTKTMHKTTAE